MEAWNGSARFETLPGKPLRADQRKRQAGKRAVMRQSWRRCCSAPLATAAILATDRSRPLGMACLLLCANRVLRALSAARPSVQIAGRRRPQRNMIDGWQMRIVFIFLLVRKYLLTVV